MNESALQCEAADMVKEAESGQLVYLAAVLLAILKERDDASVKAQTARLYSTAKREDIERAIAITRKARATAVEHGDMSTVQCCDSVSNVLADALQRKEHE